MQQGHREPPAPSPPRAVASLSVRVLGQPDRQGFPSTAPRRQDKEPAGVSQPGSAHSALNLSRSAKSSAGNHVQDDSEDDDDSEDEDWGPGPGRAGRQKKAPPSLPPTAPSMSSAAARSKRKLQPPQHILPPQVDPTPMQLRHPTPPPSPPPNLFPLPDTPKQSPPDDQERHGLREAQVASFQSSLMQRQDSDSSSRSSSPEPPAKRRPGPLSLLLHKMETEEASSACGLSEEKAHSTTAACSSESPLQHGSETDRKMKEKKERELQQEMERERRKTQEQEEEKKRSAEEKEKERVQLEERRKRSEEEKEKERIRLEEERKRRQKAEQEIKPSEDLKQKAEEKRREEGKREEEEKKQNKASQDKMVAETQDSGSSSDSDSKSDSSSHSSSSSSSSSRDKIQTAVKQKVSGDIVSLSDDEVQCLKYRVASQVVAWNQHIILFSVLWIKNIKKDGLGLG